MNKALYLFSRSSEEDRIFLELANHAFLEGYPNPQQAGCPGREVLKAIAFHKFNDQTRDIMFHVTECSGCSRDFSRFCQEYRAGKRAQSRWIMSLAATVCLTAGLSSWLWIRNGKTRESTSWLAINSPGNSALQTGITGPSHASTARGQVETVTLDLTAQMATRGENASGKAGPGKVLELPRKSLSLSIILPPGNEPGTYEIRLQSSRHEIKAAGKAQPVKGETVLEASLDTSALPAGSYQLGIRQAGWQWSSFPLELK